MSNDKCVSFIKKIEKTLLKNGAVFHSRSDGGSNSVYYNIGGVKIRVSDHFPSNNFGKCVNVVCSTNNESAIVCVRNNPIVYKNIRELNSFIHMFCDYVRCESKGSLNLIDTDIIERTESLNRLKEEVMVNSEVYQKLCSKIKEQRKTLNTIGSVVPEELNFSDLSDKQKMHIISLIKGYTKHNAKIQKKTESCQE